MAGLRVRLIVLLSGLLLAAPAHALNVAVAGAFGNKAVLVVDGGLPQTIGVGKRTREGVLLRRLSGDAATLEHGGTVFVAHVGEQVVHAAGAPVSEVSLLADAGGHFFAEARVNGRPVRALVDTGATLVSMGRGEAVRLGIDYSSGVVGQSATANGLVRVWKVRLDAVELNGMRMHGVDAAVHDSEMPFVLLGMSFMSRMDWRREGNTLFLRKRY